MTAPTEFTIEGTRFEVRRLSPEDACLSLELVSKALGPAALAVFAAKGKDDGAGDSDLANIFTALLSNASQISALLKLFLPLAKFDRGGNGILVELKPFAGEVFGGRVDKMIAFVAHSVRAEHACFLGGANALGELFQQLTGSAFSFPTAPTP